MKQVGRGYYGAIEAGGTKWICAIGSASGEIQEEIIIETRGPEETMPEVLASLDHLQKKYGKFEGLGIGTFGPVMLDRDSPRYGRYLNTPKSAWKSFHLISALRNHLGNEMPITLETDANAAALAEYELGGGKGKKSLVYITVGTGIGGGIVMNGEILHGRMHPEMGHLLVPESDHEPKRGFSVCELHRDCIEGKASGTAMITRWGITADHLDADHPAWDLEGEYLASLAITLTAVYSPDAIVFGGGVSNFEPLIGKIQHSFAKAGSEYWDLPEIEKYLLRTELNDRAGLRGALLLAAREDGICTR